MNYGIITLFPALLVVILAIKTRRTTEALLGGCFASYAIIAFVTQQNVITLLVNSFFKVITDYDTIWLVIVCGLFGSLIEIINAVKGTHAIALFLERICQSQKSTLLVSWLLGIVIFIDDYMNILTISACTKKVSDKRKIPREALAYVIDSTGAPVCSLVPFSTWAIFFAGVFYEQESIVALGYKTAMDTYIHIIPYMFYAIITIIIVPLFIIGIVPKIGAMKKAYERTDNTGMVYSKHSEKFNKHIEVDQKNSSVSIMDFLIPICTLIFVQISTDDMFIAVVSAILIAAIVYIPRGKISGDAFCDLWVQGFANSMPALTIIIAALFMRQASSDLNLPGYIIGNIEPLMSRNIYPMMAFIVVALLGFITGSNWGIPAVCAPIIIPLGAAIDANLLIVMAAIVCGGTFCSHACFYSDATVITSNVCGIDNMDHVYTQLPYALLSMILAAVAFLIAGFVL